MMNLNMYEKDIFVIKKKEIFFVIKFDKFLYFVLEIYDHLFELNYFVEFIYNIIIKTLSCKIIKSL
jgi:hypothetical protein